MNKKKFSWRLLGLVIMAIFYFSAGINHLRNPEFYLKAMPPYLPNHALIVLLSGIAEIVLALTLLIPKTRTWAAWGIILLLIAVFPANIFMATSGKFTNIPETFLWLRLPLQFVLIWWAYRFTK